MTPADEVWRAVNEITLPNKKRLIRDNGTVVWSEEPSLWDQLSEALVDHSEGGTRGVPGSRPPLDMDIAEWRHTVADLTADALVGHEKAMRETVPESVRLLASTVVSTTESDLIDEWRKTFRLWARQARTMMGQVVLPRPIRGAACPSCQVRYVQIDTTEGKMRRPALSIVFHEQLVRHAECLSCRTTWWRGEALHTLAEMIADGPEEA